MKNAIAYHIEAVKTTFSLLFKGKFLFYFIPGITAALVFYFVHTFIQSFFGVEPQVNEQVGWFSTTLVKIGSIFDFISKQFYVFLVITIFSPINTILSEKLDAHLTGQQFSFSFIRLFNDLIRMIFIVITALSLEFICIGVWWFICWILDINDTFIYTLISFVIGAFFFGFSFYDHSLERYQIPVLGSIGFAFSNILMVTSTGVVFKLLYAFPFISEISYIGVVIAPVITTMISTVVYLYHRKLLSL